jgi:hypothetical protein
MAERERRPEVVGPLAVTIVGSPDEPESEHVQGDALGQVGILDGSVVFAFAVRTDVVSLALTTRQAYHLAMCVLRARAAILKAERRASN